MTLTADEHAEIMEVMARIESQLDAWFESLTPSPAASVLCERGRLGTYRARRLWEVEKGRRSSEDGRLARIAEGEHRLLFRFQFIGLHNVREPFSADLGAEGPSAGTAWAQALTPSPQVAGLKAQVRGWIERITRGEQGTQARGPDRTAFDPGGVSEALSPVVVTPPRKFLHSPSHPLSHKRSSVLPASIGRIPLNASIER